MDYRQLLQLREKLPKNPGILGRAEFFNSAVLVLLIQIGKKYHFVFQKRSAGIRQGGEVCFPGGQIDPLKDKNSESAAIRETCEELGVIEKNLKILGRLDTLVSAGGAIIDAFVGELNLTDISSLKPDPSEVEKVFIVPVDFFVEHQPEKYPVVIQVSPTTTDEKGNEKLLFPAEKLGLPEIYQKPWGKRMQDVFIYRYQNEVIWGITARFVLDFVSKIEGEMAL